VLALEREVLSNGVFKQSHAAQAYSCSSRANAKSPSAFCGVSA
jgi:hypothetical protein